jgi:hypothetical protein
MGSISINCLGKKGRFGNQIFQYFFAFVISKKFGLTLKAPQWIGNQIFNIQAPTEDYNFVQINEKEISTLGLIENNKNFFENKDIDGYFTWHTKFYREFKSEFINLFKLKNELAKKVNNLWEEYTQYSNYTIIGIHIRLGDAGVDYYYRTPIEWYKNKIEELININGDKKFKLFIASDDLNVKKQFENYNILKIDYSELENTPDYIVDFILLSKCEILIMGNSSFSFTASMLNQNVKKVFRSSILNNNFEEIDPWDSNPLDIQIEYKNNLIKELKSLLFNISSNSNERANYIRYVYINDFEIRFYLFFYNCIRLNIKIAFLDCIFILSKIKYKIKKVMNI